ncbi:MAG: hypothetical protein ACREKE_03250, partial [bacterium]
MALPSRLTLALLLLLSFLLGMSAYARAASSITGISMSNPNPSSGQVVQVTVNYCADTGFNQYILIAVVPHSADPTINLCPVANETFLVYGGYQNRTGGTATDAVDTGTPPNSTDAIVSGYELPTASGSQGACLPGQVAAMETFNVTMPPLIGGGSYDLVGSIADNYIACNSGIVTVASTPFTEAPPAPSISISKEANQLSTTEGVAGGQVLFTIYYTLNNDSNLTITDTIPAGATLDQISPGGTSSGANLSWTPVGTNPNGTVNGQVWFLVTLNNNDTVGQTLDNTAHATSTSDPGGTASNQVSATVDGGFTLTKSESATTASAGQDVTYTLNYTYTGSSLIFYDSYDNLPGGTAASIQGSDGTPYNLLGGTPAWTVAADSDGNQFLSNPGDGDYPSLLRSAPGLPCSDYTVQGNLMVDTDNQINQDATMIIQSDSALANFYEIGISADAGPYNLFIQKTVPGVPNPVQSYSGADGINISEGIWYTVVVQFAGAGVIDAKVWQTGTPEPAAWQLTWTDPSPLPCASGGNYVGWQAQQGDSYSDLSVYAPLTAQNTELYDTLPTGLSFVSAANGGGYSAADNLVSWDLGALTPTVSSSVSWIGQVQGCMVASITNSAQIEASNVSGVASNVVTLTVQACTPTDTVTDTPTDTPTFTPTFTLTDSPTDTPTPTDTDTPTPTDTPTETITSLNTDT